MRERTRGRVEVLTMTWGGLLSTRVQSLIEISTLGERLCSGVVSWSLRQKWLFRRLLCRNREVGGGRRFARHVAACREGAMNRVGVSAMLPHLESRIILPRMMSFFSRERAILIAMLVSCDRFCSTRDGTVPAYELVSIVDGI